MTAAFYRTKTPAEKGHEAARRSVPASQNPYRAKKQRGLWAAAREAAEDTDGFERLCRHAEALVARDPQAAKAAYTYLADHYPRHVRERGLTQDDLRHCNAPAFDLLVYGRDDEHACAYCEQDLRLVYCNCLALGNEPVRWWLAWAREHMVALRSVLA